MKKILVLMVLSLVGFTTVFGCDSPLKNVKGITCELQCCISGVHNIDCKPCDKVKEKFKQFKEDFALAEEKCSKVMKTFKELELKANALEIELKVLEKHDEQYKVKMLELAYLERDIRELEKEYRDALKVSNAVLTKFLGEENMKLLYSEDFLSELDKVL